MILFKLTVTTLFCFTFFPLFTGATPGEWRGRRLFFQGILLFLPFILLWLIFYIPVPRSYRAPELFLHSFFLEHLVYAVIGGIGALFFTRPFQDRNFGKDRQTAAAVCLFFSGFLALSGVVEVIYFSEDRSIYQLFTLPLLRTSVVVAAALLFSGAVHFFSWGRVFLLLGIPLFPAIPAAISLLSKTGYEILALLFSGVLVVILTALMFFIFPKRIQEF